jgi:signal transduction histidine kinase/DNA-binding response OmpR family regulator
LKASYAIDNLVKARDRIENLRGRLSQTALDHFNALENLLARLPIAAGHEAHQIFFLKNIIAGNAAVSAEDKAKYLEESRSQLGAVKDILDRSTGGGWTADETLQNVFLEVETTLENYVAGAREIEELNAQSAAYWTDIDLVLKTMRDKIRLGSEHSINRALTSIREATGTTTTTTYVMFGLMALFIVIDFVVVYLYITRPLRWTSDKLKAIQAGKLDAKLPAINITEVSTIADLLDRFSDHLSALYRQTNQLEEEAARKKDLEEIMRAVFKASMDGYIVWNGAHIEQVSPGALKLLGLDDEADFVADHTRYGLSDEHLRNIFDMALMKGSVREELPLYTKSGEVVPCEASHLPLRFHEATCLLSYLRDLRKQKKNEAALLAAKEQAEVATRAKSEFLANMSHEIRTPMNAILGLTHLMQDTRLDQQQHDFLSQVESSAEGLLRIINDILDFSKIEAGKLEMEFTDFQLEDVMKSVINFNGLAAERKAVELIMAVPPDLRGGLIGDPVRLKQVLNNLISNAIKFTAKGSVIVSVAECAHPETVPDRICLEFKVRDTGIGLTQPQIDKLFSAFSQADTSTTRKYGGTGLGLAISKRLVEMMNGRIWCESQPGTGATFHFTARFDISEAAEPGADQQTGFAGSLAVVVGQGAAGLRTIEDYLKHMSFKVRGFLSSAEALTFLKEKPGLADILLVDWVLDGISAVEFIKEVRETASKDRLPAVLMAPVFSKAQAAEEGGYYNQVLVKPISPSDVFNSVLAAFGRRKAKAAVSKADAAELVAGIKGAKILLAEDNAVNQLVAQKIMEKAGLVVKIADNGLKALAMIEQEPFDLVLMDIQMPEMDGLEAARTLRANPKFNKLPVVAMTAHAMSGDRELSLEAGMNDHITKPIDLLELFSTLAHWIPKKGG